MKKTLAIFLALIFTLSLFACGKKNNEDELECFLNGTSTYIGYKKDAVWLKIEETTGVKFRLNGAASDYYNVLSPLMNTIDEAPDICFVNPESLGLSAFYDVWCKDKTGLVYSYEELLAQYPEGTFPYIENILYESNYSDIKQNGSHHLLPYIKTKNYYGLYYRTDWLIACGYYQKDSQGNAILDEKGNKIARYPENMDEFTEVLELFTNIGTVSKQNGVTVSYNTKGTYGISPHSDCFTWSPFYHAFGVLPNWGIYGDSIDYMYATDEFGNFLEWASDIYKKGYVYPTFNERTGSTDRDLFYDGTVGILCANSESHVKYIMDRMKNVGLADAVGFGPAPKGTANIGVEGVGGFSDLGGYWGGFCISRTCTGEKLKKALTLLNYMISPEGMTMRTWGIEDVHYKVVNGEKIIDEECIENRALEGNAFQSFIDEEGGEALPTGKYNMGFYWGGIVDWSTWTGGEILCQVDAYFIDHEWKDIVQEGLDQSSTVSSKITTFTDFPISVQTIMNKYQDTAKSYVNSVINGTISVSDWEKKINDLKSSKTNQALFEVAKNTLKDNGFLD